MAAEKCASSERERAWPRERRNSFDALRVAAALCVFFGHQCDLFGYPEPTLGPLSITVSNTGLFVFFAISGYLISQSLERNPNPAAFLRARALRIYPGAVANTLACVMFGAVVTTLPAASYWADAGTWRYLTHGVAILAPPTVFGLPGVFADARWPNVDTPIWTLKYELLCYGALLAAWSFAGALRMTMRTALAIGAALFVIAYVWRTSATPPPPAERFYSEFNTFNTFRFGMVFCAGALYAALGPRHEGLRLGLTLIAAALVVLAPAAEAVRAGVLLLVVPLAIEVGRSPLLFWGPYNRFGDLSYGFYLYAYPVQVLLVTRLSGRMGFWTVTLLALVLTGACAVMSWRLVERPALRWKRRFAAPEASRSAAL